MMMPRLPFQYCYPVFLATLVLANALAQFARAGETVPAEDAAIISRDRLVAWCIVPFDQQQRGPVERAAMLKRLGIKRLAYDYRAEHIPTFAAEIAALKEQQIELTAWWFPTTLSDEAHLILNLLEKTGQTPQLWVTGDGGPIGELSPSDYQTKVKAEAARIRPIALAAQKIGCRVSLYNHGNWFGEPLNQIAIIKELNLPSVGLVYNLHHGHHHVEQFKTLLATMLPYLDCLNLNGMQRSQPTHLGGTQPDLKILPIGVGEDDPALMQIILDSGYTGPLGILNHTSLDAELRLKDNLAGLDWVTRLVTTGFAGPLPQYLTYSPTPPPAPTDIDAPPQLTIIPEYSPDVVAHLLQTTETLGDPARGKRLFGTHRLGCAQCHQLAGQGGRIGPALDGLATERTGAQIVESLFWPQREVKPQYVTWLAITDSGQVIRGYKQAETDNDVTLVDPSTRQETVLLKLTIEELVQVGSAMPAELMASLNEQQQADLIAFLRSLRGSPALPANPTDNHTVAAEHQHGPAQFAFERGPISPADYPSWEAHINRDRIYDFYTKQANYFKGQHSIPETLGPFPGLDGGTLGHWGNQNEATWADDRWSQTDVGSFLSGVFAAGNLVIPRAMCVHFADQGDLALCFDAETCDYRYGWQGGFIQFSAVRHSFMDPIRPKGTAIELNLPARPTGETRYKGLYRAGKQVVFHYTLDGIDWLDAPLVTDGRLSRDAGPAATHRHRDLFKGAPAQWPETFVVQGQLGSGSPYAVDTIPLPTENPWKALLFCGGHAFLPDGSALVTTMQGDVWLARGLDPKLTQVVWKRFASGLHQPLGIWIDHDGIFVLGRDQITRLVDLNGDDEADSYEAFSQQFIASAAGHDYNCGLERDSAGNFYFASGKEGLVQISADGKTGRVLATGFRNPDGVGAFPDGTITIPCSEGDWTPASMICALTPEMQRQMNRDTHIPFFGWGGPRDNQPPTLPLVYLPRGLDNSAGGQTVVTSRKWGPLWGQTLHFSFGTGTHFLLLRDQVGTVQQGGIVPLVGEFRSGAHRGRFNPVDGQLYVSGMNGWGCYTTDDGCFQRVRYTGGTVQVPTRFHVHANGVAVTFSEPLDKDFTGMTCPHFAQAWNYRYSGAYGSPELTLEQPAMAGHTVWPIASATVLPDGKTLFLEIPDLQPVNQLHLQLGVAPDQTRDLFVTVHQLDKPFTSLPNYRPAAKRIEPHPLLRDLRTASQTKRNPYRKPIDGAREVTIAAGSNLAFQQKELRAKPGELIKLVFQNPDVVPHNWALLKPGTLAEVGAATNKLIADPDAYARQYLPDSPDVLYYTDIVQPGSSFTIYFNAPDTPGRYPYLCTFPGHWMVMNGELLVE